MSSPKKTIRGTRTFFSTLFDFSFANFITVQMFPAIYGIILASSLVGIGYLTFEAFMETLWKGAFYLTVAGPVAFIAIAVITRALMELYIVIFRLAANVDELYALSQKLTGVANTMDGVREITRKLPLWNLVGSKTEESRSSDPKRPSDSKDDKKAAAAREERKEARDKVTKEKPAEKEKPRKARDVNWPY
ncbi:Hypothetical protein HDN1F_21350 [gamma proteobacterium HdN1]|nr:Hypothetical protein HDN1F_21350 [gamma proteobacterium HdN1]